MKLTVLKVIKECIKILEEEYLIDLNKQPELYELYGASKDKNRASDIPCISMDQKIKGTGFKRFYL
jgi:hypothetical protein